MNGQRASTYRILKFLPAALLAAAVGTVGWILFAGEHVHFVRPAALLLGVSLPWLWWVSRRSLGGLGRWTHTFVVLLRLMIVRRGGTSRQARQRSPGCVLRPGSLGEHSR